MITKLEDLRYQIGTPINRKVNTPGKESVMKPAVIELGFQVLKMQLWP